MSSFVHQTLEIIPFVLETKKKGRQNAALRCALQLKLDPIIPSVAVADEECIGKARYSPPLIRVCAICACICTLLAEVGWKHFTLIFNYCT